MENKSEISHIKHISQFSSSLTILNLNSQINIF